MNDIIYSFYCIRPINLFVSKRAFENYEYMFDRRQITM